MRDPLEGLAADGTITTGVARHRVPADFEPLLTDLVARAPDGASLFLYGSLATGRAVVGRSDVDLIALGMDAAVARSLARELSATHRELTSGVAIGVWTPSDLGIGADGPMPASAIGDATHGNRIFLRHYCALLIGPDPLPHQPAFSGDRRAARGFNGDFPDRVTTWRRRLADLPDADLAPFCRAVGRTSLFATAGLVSVHDHTWTTDRATAARRWGELNPHLRDDLDALLALGDGGVWHRQALERLLGAGVQALADQFRDRIGVWDEHA